METLPPQSLSLLVLVEAGLFVATMALASGRKTMLVAEYVGTVFHLLLLPVIAALPLPPVWQATGLAWVVCDVMASIGMLWTANRAVAGATDIFHAVRMAGHLFAGIWIASVSISLGDIWTIVGGLLAFSFASYTLAAGWLPEKALAVPGVLLVGWLLLLSRHFQQTVS